jgi:hypothetical protein
VDHLPPNIMHLTFGTLFNKSVTSLPNSITHLTFGKDFNQTVSSLPKKVTHLTFGEKFNQSLSSLPRSVTHLTLGKKFNQKLPKYVTHLKLATCYKIKSHGKLPEGLREIAVVGRDSIGYPETDAVLIDTLASA